jgi:DNA-directed RNA polymerase specialized sigma24 family protein
MAAIASRMQRTEGAVQMLCNRALKALRHELLGLLGV